MAIFHGKQSNHLWLNHQTWGIEPSKEWDIVPSNWYELENPIVNLNVHCTKIWGEHGMAIFQFIAFGSPREKSKSHLRRGHRLHGISEVTRPLVVEDLLWDKVDNPLVIWT